MNNNWHKKAIAAFIIVVVAVSACTIVFGPPNKFGFGGWPQHECDNRDCMK